jgi:hypothetical protein
LINQNRIHTFATRKRGDEKAGKYIKRIEKREKKKIEESFVGMGNNSHLCDPQLREKREKEAV